MIQWFWVQALREAAGDGPLGQFDQFNSIHERLIEAWQRVARELGKQVAFASLADTLEDNMTAAYLRDTAIQGGMQTESIAVQQIGWNAGRRAFTDLRERPIPILFKLYPWEWMLGEEFGRHLLECSTHFLEPPWKMVLSSKGILPILYELFPDSPYLLPTGFEPLGASYVAKPTHSREGANITIVHDNEVIAETDGAYGDGPWVYQQYHPLPNFGGKFPRRRELDRQRARLRDGHPRGRRPDHPEHQPLHPPPLPQVQRDQASRLPRQLPARPPRRGRPPLGPLDRPLTIGYLRGDHPHDNRPRQSTMSTTAPDSTSVQSASRARARPWWRVRLSLRAMMVLVLVIGWPLGWKARRAATQRRAVAAAVALGGQITYEDQIDPMGRPRLPHRPWGPAWLRNLLGDEFFQEVAWVHFVSRPQGRMVDDETIAVLNDFDHLQGLNLQGQPRDEPRRTRPTASSPRKGLARLGSLPRLRSLGMDFIGGDAAMIGLLPRWPTLEHITIFDLARTIPGSSLAAFADLPRLQFVRINAIEAGGAGDFAQLAALPELKHLSLNRSPASDAGLDRLAARHQPQVVDLLGTELSPATLAAWGRRPALEELSFDGSRLARGDLKVLAGQSRLDGTCRSSWMATRTGRAPPTRPTGPPLGSATRTSTPSAPSPCGTWRSWGWTRPTPGSSGSCRRTRSRCSP